MAARVARLLCTLLSAVRALESHHNFTWAYAPSHGCHEGKPCGPNEWYKLPGFGSCAQQGTQSPINMKLSEAQPTHDLNFSMVTKGPCREADFDLNEHTVEVEFKDSCQDTYYVTYKGMTCKLLQTHYHSPSENQWDGKYFPMEAHYVHKCVGTPDYVVLATMIGVGKPTSSMLDEILDEAPMPTDAKDNFYSKVDRFRSAAYDLLPKSTSSKQYVFEGSMTTPPCNPGPTHWVMSTDVAYVTQTTLDKYRAHINANADSQLAPFGTIVGLGADAAPTFNEKAGNVLWIGGLGSCNRPIQALRGKDNPTRVLYLASSAPVDKGVTADYDTTLYAGVAAGVSLLVLIMAAARLLSAREPAPEATYEQMAA
eukprot:TRINITY_DN38709_c0_g1_i1.p1 TRINITY_DN38709_c0_g1~~TRINITY_DN38709_c0_g1_i1.p1  ORF type:complete len:369 (-),score=71.13 TRINITY_DN38709_c0_g1_i1:105-1211(-)